MNTANAVDCQRLTKTLAEVPSIMQLLSLHEVLAIFMTYKDSLLDVQ